MNSEEISEIYFGDVDAPLNPGRREFIKKLGAGLFIIFSVHPFGLSAEEEEDKVKREDFNLFLRIRDDGRVECYTGKIEMGQGITTSLAQALAEELEVSLNSIDMIMGDTDLCPYDAGTWGSLTTRTFDPVLRAAAIEARMELIKLAATELKTPEDQLKTENGFVVGIKDNKLKVSYGSLTKGKRIVKTIKRAPVFKKPADFKQVGKQIPATNAILKVTGEAKYAGDIQLPGMLYAAVSRPPAHGCKLLSADKAKAEGMPGVKVIVIENLVAALHANPNTAANACAAIKTEWSKPEVLATDKTIFSYLVQEGKETRIVEEKGNLDQGFAGADFVLESEYHDGYKAHASIETHTATAYFEGDRLIIWASTQTPFGTRKDLAAKLNMPLEKVLVKQVLLGGGFGGKIYGDQAIEAALLAKEAGTPVQLAWTREEEFMYDKFRSAAVMQIKAGVKKDGKIVAWKYNIYCAGNRGVNDFYGIPNLRSALYDKKGIHPFGTGAWRAPGNNTTTFARESHIDVLADKIGMDPLAFRLANVSDPKMERTLRLAAKTFNYTSAKPGKNRGCGMALGFDAGTFVAIIAEVEVNPSTGAVKVLRVVCAQDMGQVVNPHGARVQSEGGITMGLGYALYEDVQFNWGEVVTRNFDTYEITRFSTTAPVEAVFVDDMNAPPQGGGEPAIICIGGAIANAVFHASGARVNQMPVTPERILEKIKQS
ncbi:MAG TPA: molybdopterin cofactor-binding domain-containing protein [Prolixibacteraceae bacterium]|nr:molybdopterin cofactor-binding domain-containing protein [Prolixibacteraceae bacterium]